MLNQLKKLKQELLTQDNLCTEDVIFTVQKRKIITGMDTDFCDNICWIHDDCESDIITGKDSHFDKLEKAFWDDAGTVTIDNEEQELNNYTRTAYTEIWENIEFFFTNKAAKEFIENNAHRHGGKDNLRIYGESAYRNPELKLIRNYILSLED